ncbi:MAG: hypothetical protein JST40_00285 [Armatimonadetes bacterium]|nr:hypothetical protein [Armatimonadota bacterium]
MALADHDIVLPEVLWSNVQSLEGANAPATAERAIANVLRLLHEWKETPIRIFDNAYCSLVVETEAGHVLKVPVVGEELTSGYRATRAMSGFGGPRVLRFEDETSASLMHRLTPGTTLAEVNLSDAEGIPIVCDLLRQLWNAPEFEPGTAEEWFAPLLDPGETPSLVRERELCLKLIATTTDHVRAHADLHHYNVLLDGPNWFMIDPKGIWIDPAFEPCAFIRNCLDRAENVSAAIRHRIIRFAELLELPASRIWAWALVETKLSSYDASSPLELEFASRIDALEALESEFWP